MPHHKNNDYADISKQPGYVFKKLERINLFKSNKLIVKIPSSFIKKKSPEDLC